jgi:VanZ family protein
LSQTPVAQSSIGPFTRYWLPVLVYVAVIATLSAQPGLKPPETIDLSDKFYHALEYFGLGLLLARAFRAGRRITNPIRSTTFVLAVGVLIAVCDEIFQSFIPGRSSDLFDILADATGLVLAKIVFLLLIRD